MENLPTSSSKTPREVACNSTGHALENRLSDLEPQSHLLGAMWYVMFFVAQVVFFVKDASKYGVEADLYSYPLFVSKLSWNIHCYHEPETFIATMKWPVDTLAPHSILALAEKKTMLKVTKTTTYLKTAKIIIWTFYIFSKRNRTNMNLKYEEQDSFDVSMAQIQAGRTCTKQLETVGHCLLHGYPC